MRRFVAKGAARLTVVALLLAVLAPATAASAADPAPGSISGTVRDVEGAAVGMGHVDLFDEAFAYLSTVDAAEDGTYTIPDLAPGTYHLAFWNGDADATWDYFVEVYQNQPLLRAELATPVVVGAGEDITGVDARLRWLYDDMFGSTFQDDIYWMGNSGITLGCNPPANYLYCPDREVTRGEMAAFLARTFSLADRGTASFVDDDGSLFEADIEKLASAGITFGCNPPDNDRFCPDDPVTRGQMAAFLHRAVEKAAGSPQDLAAPQEH